MQSTILKSAASFITKFLFLTFLAASCNELPAPQPEPDGSIDLTSENSYANCFIVSEKGEYSFAARHVDGTEITDIESADWVWSTKENGKGLISDVSFHKGIVRFTASEGKGNALIAATDRNRNIIWSWHIWMTDMPEHQHLDNGTCFMDRNLGATGSEISDGPLTYGLKYQWGRKDPFYGGAKSENTAFTEAVENTILNPKYGLRWETALCSPEIGTMEYAIQHPTTFIYTTDDLYSDTIIRDWMWVQDDYLWSDEQTSAKTNHDPCPHGYRTPHDDAWSGVGYYNAFDNNDGGKTHTTESGTKLWCPLCGTRWGDQDAGKLGYVFTPPTEDIVGGGQGIYWKQTTKLCGHNAGCFYIINGTYVSASYGMYRAHGAAVRCEYIAESK